ncbi:MAG TPA: hydantoinase/oxoprolinase family protein [Acidimicrobiales bacterium]|nr:hydantoinase/oxoprolinase family protein [Acidimicrobiales bacterium]
MADWRAAVDIGGTFTDVVLLDGDTGRVVVDKTLSTPARPLEGVTRGVLSALRRAGIGPADVRAPVVHATTLVTNALIEGKVARAALVTNAGFGDTLLIRNEHRYDMYDLQIEFPPPPVPRSLTFEVGERTTAEGVVLQAPEPSEVHALAEQLAGAGVEAVAVSLLHSYANPASERTVARLLAEDLGVPVCASSDVAPQIREYPRTVTTACNAATMPVVGPYLDEFSSWLAAQGFGGGLLIMLSNGGVVSADVAARNPIRMVESGPAAGALAGAWYAARLGFDRLLCFDMGGTTAKSCLIEHHEPELTTDFEIARMYRFKKGSGFPVTIPSVDLVEIGAGGGSIARVDELGLLKVGPESAGAEPGPACYGRGGTQPTVTDTDVLLGNLDPAFFLGGDMALDAEAALRATAKLGEALGTAVEDTAGGVHDVVNQNMAAAARMHAIERGADLRGTPLIAFGGAGPVHACGVAELLESPSIVFPANASVLSAFGALVTPVRIDLARSLVRRLDQIDPAERVAVLEEMREEGRRVLTGAGVPPGDVTFRYAIDARYHGQGNEITIDLGAGAVPDREVEERFAARYAAVYGMTIPDVPVEVVTWRVAASAPAPRVSLVAAGAPGGAPQQKGVRQVRFHRGSEPVATPVYDRLSLPIGATVSGPALLEERETTTVLRPGWVAVVTDDGSVLARREGAA